MTPSQLRVNDQDASSIIDHNKFEMFAVRIYIDWRVVYFI